MPPDTKYQTVPSQAAPDTVAYIVGAFAQRPDTGIDDIIDLAARLSANLFGVDTPRPEIGVAPLPPAAEPDKSASGGEAPPRPVPATDIASSVSPTQIKCLCCGRGFQTLKRHLKAAHGLTEPQYREMWGLSEDYPLVAPEYSQLRSHVATKHQFGKHARPASAPTD